MYGIFRGVYFGEHETENYRFGFVQLAVTSAFFSVLTTINFTQYSLHKSRLKIRFSHWAPVSYYYSLICYWYYVTLIPLCFTQKKLSKCLICSLWMERKSISYICRSVKSSYDIRAGEISLGKIKNVI